MKGDKKVIDVLNKLISEELTATSQYVVHSKMCSHWGYYLLDNHLMCSAKQEMHHIDELIKRVLFLEGEPDLKQGKLHIGNNVKTMLENDLELEQEAIDSYNEAIKIAMEAEDAGTCCLLKHNLKEEEHHLCYLEQQLVQIEQTSIESYLSNQTEGGTKKDY